MGTHSQVEGIPARDSLHVLHLIPGSEANEVQMSFAKQQVESLLNLGIRTDSCYIDNSASLVGFFKGIVHLKKLINSLAPDIVHAHYGSTTGLIAVLLKRTPLVVTFRGSDLNPDPSTSRIKSFMKRMISQLAALFADRIITVSSELSQQLWWKQRIVSIIPSGVDLDRFSQIERMEAREKIGWTGNDCVLIFNSGNFSANKRQDLAEKVLARLKGRFPGIRLVTLASNISPREMPVFLSASDCLLMLSDFEGSPNIVKEAMACNLPIVTFDVGDVRRWVEGTDECVVVPRDMEALVSAVDGVLLRRNRSNGRERIKEISLDKVAHQIASVYREAIKV